MQRRPASSVRHPASSIQHPASSAQYPAHSIRPLTTPILVAVYDPEEGDFQSICRIMSGFTDEMYQSIFDTAQDWIVNSKPTNVVTKEDCRVWFKPSVVWEIRGADLTVSPKHMAALGIHAGDQAETKGLGLRFPRFRKLRTDKVPTQATSSHQISEFFDQQRT